MKSSRSRSRSKNSRSRSSNSGGGGNVVNRVFDSSGPEGKVRGTPAQIIDKYNQLARDAQVSGDRVATENFQQHAEHYLRMLSEAQREIDSRREEQERQNRERQLEQDRQNRERQAERDRERAARPDVEAQPQAPRQPQSQPQPHPQPTADLAKAPQPDLVESDKDSGLVDTPESQPKPKPKPRPRTRKPKTEAPKSEAPKSDDAPDAAPRGDDKGSTPEAAE
jgi:hypothetical protein